MFEVVGRLEAELDGDDVKITMVHDVHDVYECWVSGDKGSFTKITDEVKVLEWLDGLLDDLPHHRAVHITKHSSDEYA